MVKIANIEITQQLYESNDCLIYRGDRASDRRPVVLKMLKDPYPSPERLAWFQREYEVTRSLQQLPGVIKTYTLERDRQRPVMVLEDFGGDSLALLRLAGKLPLAEFLHLAIAIAQTLGKIHEASIVHKDLNPSNIVYNPETGTVKIIDFGISAVLSQENPVFENIGVLEGTLAYLSPEQTGRMNRVLDYRSDFYSLGATFYELLAGVLPFESDDPMELVHCHLAKTPRFPHTLETGRQAKIPKMLSDIVLKLMAKNAEDRYQSAWGLKDDLEKCLQQWEETGEIEPFELGKRDRGDRFQIPQKLYGRDREVAQLLAAFERVSHFQSTVISQQLGERGNEKQDISASPHPPVPTSFPTPSNSELILVAGYSGAGKTAAVREVHKPITAKRGRFIAGKFDQYKRNIPYSALRQAFNELCDRLLVESEAVLEVWRDKIQAAVGKNGQVLIEVIPSLERAIGPQPTVAKVGAQEGQNRFKFVFQNFIKAICHRDRPLVLFIDDLQWADGASLSLLKTILGDGDLQGLLIIGAYRDNEVNASHPLMLALESIEAERGKVTKIELKNLTPQDVNALVADTLSSSPQTIQPLSDLVYEKTLGNAFFLLEFLKSLYAEGLLKFNRETSGDRPHWQWNCQQIQQRQIADNVVDLMASKIGTLGPQAHMILQLAACIGNQFDLQTLAIIYQCPPPETLKSLWTAVKEGLIIPLNEQYKLIEINPQISAQLVRFKFQHDRVQQAAYSLITDYQKQVTHLKIGRLLLNSTPGEKLESKIFDIVNQFNASVALLCDEKERLKLAKLNLLAGKKAKSVNAYSSAAAYFQVGRSLLPQTSWITRYKLALDLYESSAEAAYLNGDFAEHDRLAATLLQEAQTVLDRVPACELQIQVYTAQNKLQEAVESAIAMFRQLGIKFPKNPRKLDIILRLLKTKVLLLGKKPSDFLKLPPMTDATAKAVMELIPSVGSAAYVAVPDLVPLLVFKLVELSVKYGNAPQSPYGYAAYGFILCGGVGDIELGSQFGRLASQLLNEIDARDLKAKTSFVITCFIAHWHQPLRATLPAFLEGYQWGLETGDLEYTAWSVQTYCYYAYFSGKKLGTLEPEFVSYGETIRQLKQEISFTIHRIYWQVVANLTGSQEPKSRPGDLCGDIYDERVMLPQHQQGEQQSPIFHLHLNKLMLCYWFGEYEEAANNGAIARQYLESVIGLAAVPIFHFYESLAQIAIAADLPPYSSRRHKLLARVKTNQKKLKKWAAHAPANCWHKFYLVEGERDRVFGKGREAMDLYERAIRGARDYSYRQEEALAYELAARFYRDRGLEKFAQTYIIEAHYAYLCWGAKVKAEQLEQQYPQWLSQTRSGEPFQRSTATQTTLSSDNKASIEFDIASVLKASQALSGEIVLDTLLDKMMQLVLENAGAEIGYLMVRVLGGSEEEWTIVASGNGAADEGEVSQGTSLADRENASIVPLTIANYVLRTQESLVLGDATQAEMFADDPYIIAQQPKSVLCVPLLNQGNLLGLLYLENNPIADAFTPDRVEVLKLLSLQGAIALENAQLYAEVRASESRLTQFLEAIPVAIGVLDATGRPYYGNAKAIELLGKGIDPNATPDLLSEVYQNYVAGSDRLYPWEELPIVRALQGEICTADDIEIHQGDKITPVEAWGTPIYDDRGNIAYALTVFQDISDRRAAEKLLADYNRTLEAQVAERTEALQESEQRFTKAFETAATGMGLTAPDGHFLAVNDSICKLLGYSEPEMLNLSVQEITDPADLAASRDALKHLLAGETRYYHTEKRYRHKDGRTIWGLLSTAVIRDSQDRPLYFIFQIQDINERRQAEARLRQRNREMQAIFEAFPDLFFRMDATGTILDYQTQEKGELYAPPEQFLGKNVRDILPPAIGEQIQEAIGQALASNSVISLEYPLTLEAGEQQFESRIMRLQDEQVIAVTRNISDRKQAEIALKAAKEAAEKANQAKSDFLASMSHELRTPLNAILGFSQLMACDSAIAPEQREHLAIINRSGEHLLTLINDILSMSKIEAGRAVLNETEFNLHRLLNNLREMLNLKATRKGLTLIVDYSPQLPQQIQTDESKLRQVLINLVGNAIKFTTAGQVTLSVSEVRRQATARRKNDRPISSPPPAPYSLKFEVTDTGPGIVSAEIDALFQPFAQTETGRNSGEGTGLGLPISREFVRLMGGDIIVCSQVGQGSAFTFTIPVGLGQELPRETKQSPQQIVGLEPTPTPYRILVVEDMPENRQLLLQMLEPVGFEVREAANGQAGVAVWQSWQPHLILMDLRMPVMDGFTAMRKIRAEEESSIPIIALTASAFEEQQTATLAAGGNDFLPKPFRREELLEMLGKHLGVRYMYGDKESPAQLSSVQDTPLTLKDLQMMPAEWIEQLHQAAIAADDGEAIALIQTIPPAHSQVMQALTEMVSNFQWEVLIAVTSDQ